MDLRAIVRFNIHGLTRFEKNNILEPRRLVRKDTTTTSSSGEDLHILVSVCRNRHQPGAYLEVYEMNMNRMVSRTSSIDQSPTLSRALRWSRKYAVVDIVEINAVNRPNIVFNRLARSFSKFGMCNTYHRLFGI